MIPEDIIYLRCIACGKGLALEQFKSQSGECISGKLSCAGCQKEFPVINGIPRLLSDDLMQSLVVPNYPDFFARHKVGKAGGAGGGSPSERLKKRTAESFGFEWLKYPKILEHFESDWARYFNPFIKKKDIKGKVVADFGCGMAKHGYFIGKYKAAKYIGLDLSMAVEAAYRNTRKFKPLIVQADIYAPGLNGQEIDIFYSIGVLHHMPDPEGGFLSIARLMRKKGSRVFIWVYGKHNNARALYLYNPVRVVTTRMPRSILYPLCHVPAVALHSINLVQKGLNAAGLKGAASALPFSYYQDFPYKFKVSDCFDVFGTPKQVYYEMKDIAKWFRHAGFKNREFTLAFDVVQGIKGFGRR